MKFSEVLKALEGGKRVRHRDWDSDVYIHMDRDNNYISMDQLLSDDWEVIKETKEFRKLEIGDEFISPFGSRCVRIMVAVTKDGLKFNAIRLIDSQARFMCGHYKCELE